MSSRNRIRPSKRAVASHREALSQTRAAVREWAAGNSGREIVVASILQLLAGCARDTDGDKTLDAVADVFEEHAEVLSPALAHQLAGAIVATMRAPRIGTPESVVTRPRMISVRVWLTARPETPSTSANKAINDRPADKCVMREHDKRTATRTNSRRGP